MLELAIAKELYDRYPDASEGRLAKIRSHVVSRQSCAAVARELRLGERLGEAAGEALAGDELSRIVKSRNVTAALLEAAIAALFLEHGYEPIEPAIVAAFSDRIEYARTTHVDHKTELQEALAKSGRSVTLPRARRRGPGPRAPLLLRGADRRRGARHGHRAARRRKPSRRPPSRRWPRSARRPRNQPWKCGRGALRRPFLACFVALVPYAGKVASRSRTACLSAAYCGALSFFESVRKLPAAGTGLLRAA